MNNNRGWGLRSELWICFSMILFFAIAVILINRVFTKAETNGTLPTKENDNVEEVVPKVDSKKEDSISQTNKNDNIKEEKEEIKNNTNYSNLEDKIVLAGSKYANKYFNSESSNKVVTVVRLQTEGLIDKLEVNDTKCSGYIKIDKIGEEFKYYPYLKCGALYQTAGYDENLDNTDL